MHHKPTRIFILMLPILIPTLLAGSCCKDDPGKITYATPNVHIYIDESRIDGLYAPGTVWAEDEITFRINARDEVDEEEIVELLFAVRVYSPDGAEWSTVTAEAPSEVESPLAPNITYHTVTGSLADTVAFEARSPLGVTLRSEFDDEVMAVTIGPIDASYEGKQICIDRSDFPPVLALPWLWSTQRTASGGISSTGEPTWEKELCFTVGPPHPPLQVSIDNLDEITDAGGIRAGEIVTFNIRLSNDTERMFEAMTLGFRIFPKTNENVTWTMTEGEAFPALQNIFDQVNYKPLEGPGTEFGLNGYGADTIGFATWGTDDHTGMLALFDEVSYWIRIGPIDEAFIGEEICIDSSWFRPTNPWLWDADGSDATLNIFPSWYDAPQCFEIISP